MKGSLSKGVRQPHEYPRRLLFAVTGLSPQVITETCYALAVNEKPAFLPTEIHILTTSEGRDRIRHTLLSRQPGWFRRLLEEYGLPRIRFGLEQVHLVSGKGEDAFADIRDAKANARAADAITELVREFTANEDTALHVSIAGGRKTMGFYAGYALSLYGRPQDRLSHVLVSAPFEGNHDFFYPTRKSEILYTSPPESRPIDASEARVSLAMIPFVRLRHGVPPELRQGQASYSEVVEATQRALGPVRLIIDVDQQRVSAGEIDFHLPPAELAFLSWFARRQREGRDALFAPADGVPEIDYANEYLAELDHIRDAEYGRTGERLHGEMDKAFFEQTLSRLRRDMRAALGIEGEQRYGIRAQGRPRRYQLAVPAEAIEWLGPLT